MAEPTHVDELLKGAVDWNRWRDANPRLQPNLSGHDFRGMNVAGMDFHGANLRGVRMTRVDGLLPGSLAGADLTNAQLPANIVDFAALEHVAEVSKHARNNFLAVIAGCVFSWLTIAQTSDAQLLVNKETFALPVLGTEVPVGGFFLAAPAILLALYIYLHIYLQRLWDGLARLPAIFPDGTRLDQRAFPWLLSGLVSVFSPLLRRSPPPFTLMQVALSLVAAWLLVPLTIGWFWLRYLLVTDLLHLAPHMVLLALSLTAGALFYSHAHVTLRVIRPAPVTGRPAWRGLSRFMPISAVMVLVWVVAVGSMTVALRTHSGFWHLDLRRQFVSGTKTMTEAQFAVLNELDLSLAHFSDADADEAVLVKAILRNAVLRRAKLEGADLRGADFNGADLSEARLLGAKLNGASFQNTRLSGTQFGTDVDLQQVALGGACGRGVLLPAGLSVPACPDEVATTAMSVGPSGSSSTVREPVSTVFANGAEPGNKSTFVPGETFKDCEVCPELVVIPAGSFAMGSPLEETDRDVVEGPVRIVRIAEPFSIGRYEVTFAEWDACVAAGGCTREPEDEGWGRGRRPVINVSWTDAQQYVTWLSRQTRQIYRLPSEAQWEYAARAGTETRYWWGDASPTDAQANFGRKHGGTVLVGSFKPNAFGVYDSAGNVWEWVEDRWHGSYQGGPIDGSAWNDGSDDRRVLRGSSWLIFPKYLRSAYRGRSSPIFWSSSIGFRVCRTLSR